MNASIIWKPRRADFYKRLIMDIKEILGKCDHTLLSPDATFEQIKELIDEGIFFGVASCCIPPRYVSRAAEYAAGRVKICTVIGFPNGYNTLRVKVFETWNAVLNGADEIDMVINIGELKSGNYDYILKEVTEIKKACYGRPLKVIIETCLLTDEEKIKITDFISYLYTKNLEIYEFMDNLKDVISTIKKEKMKGNTDIIFIDLINRINNPEADIKNRAEYLGGITRKLKLLAGKLDIPIVITAQINRVVEGRQDKRPTLADIKESGGIAEDSDLVLGLYRDRELERREVRESLNDKGILDYNSKNADCNPNAIELLILKGRNINIGTYSFYWNGAIQRIGNWSN